MLPQEKVADAIFKWEKYARTTRSQKELKLTFKVSRNYLRLIILISSVCVSFWNYL